MKFSGIESILSHLQEENLSGSMSLGSSPVSQIKTESELSIEAAFTSQRYARIWKSTIPTSSNVSRLMPDSIVSPASHLPPGVVQTEPEA